MNKFAFIGIALATGVIWSAPASACQGDSCANGLAYEKFGPPSSQTLAVFIHGDVSAGGPSDYMYSYAKAFAASHKIVAVALLRPGHYDRAGRRSGGSDNGRRDSFQSSQNRAIAGAIRELQGRYGARRVIALGHSAGAGTLGVLAGSGGFLSGVVLASCPCDVRAWDEARGRGGRSQSQSPIDYVAGTAGLPIVAVTGATDDNTRPALAEAYVQKAKAAGARASVQIVGGGHGFGGGVGSASVAALGRMVR